MFSTIIQKGLWLWWKPEVDFKNSPAPNLSFKSNFFPAVVGAFLSGLDYFGRESAIFGARSQWSGEIAIFHPHIASHGKDFVASGLSGLENQSCLAKRKIQIDRRNHDFWLSWGPKDKGTGLHYREGAGGGWGPVLRQWSHRPEILSLPSTTLPKHGIFIRKSTVTLRFFWTPSVELNVGNLTRSDWCLS